MEFEAKDNWEALFETRFLRWFHLMDKPVLIEIVSLEKGVALVCPGGKESIKPILHYKVVKGELAEIKPLVLNHTNAKALAKMFGRKPSGWVGNRVVLFPTTTRLGPEEVPCIRVRESRDQPAKGNPNANA